MKHKKLTALVLCFTMLFSITSGIFSAVFAADSTTGSAYHLDTTTGSGVWSSTTESAYKADNGPKLFSTKKTVTTESSIKTTGREISMNLTSYGDYTTNEASEQRIINRDGIEFYGSLENLEAVPATFVSGVEGLQIAVTSKTIFKNDNNEATYVLCGYEYVGDNQKFKEVAANYPYIPEQYTLEIVANHDMIGKTVAFKNATAVLYDNINGYAVGIDGTKFGNMVVEAVMVDGDATWYYVNTVDTAWPEDYPGYHCVKATDVKVVEEEEDETLIIPCPICGVANCSIAHLYCDICGEFDCGEKHKKPEPVRPATTPVIPTNPTLTEGADVSIVDEYGDAVTEEGFILAAGMRSSLSAWSDLEDEGNESYQWQICYDTENKLWADIQGQTGKGMLISPAMVMSIIETEGTALIRCEVTLGNKVKYSAEIPVTVAHSASPAMARFALPRVASNDAVVTDTADMETRAADTYSVVINYVLDGTIVADPYTATLAAGSNFKATVSFPTIRGYLPYLGEATESTTSLALTITNIQEDKTYTVIYKPTLVNYKVSRYQQNLTDDQYTKVEEEILQGLTKSTVLEEDVEKNYPGFYALLYEKPAIAADGSTEVEIYYDRNYYLVNFELDGGYGTEPIYGRYGTPITAEDPSKAGYTFAGWSLNGITEVDLATTISKDVTYIALWTPGDPVNYTVVYWRENADNTNYSYWTQQTMQAPPGSIVSGSNSVAQYVDDEAYFTYNDALTDKNVEIEGDGSTIINVYYNRNYYTIIFYYDGECNIEEHTHGTDCVRELICGADGHVHNADCKRTLACELEEHVHSETCTPVCGKENHTEHTSAECIICGKTEHTAHTSDCLICGYTEHRHSSACCTITYHKHNTGCYGSGIGNAFSWSWDEHGVTGNEINGYIGQSFCRTWGGLEYTENKYIYIDGTWYRYTGNVTVGGTVSPSCGSTEHDHTSGCDYCSQKEHTHSEENGCYSDVIHFHTDKCYDELHTHSDGCYNHPSHSHTENCYGYQCGQKPHTHDSTCYRACTKYEHAHSNACRYGGYGDQGDYEIYKVITAKYDAYIGDQWPTADDIKGFAYWTGGGLPTGGQSSKIMNMTSNICINGGNKLLANYASTKYTLKYWFEHFDQTVTPDETTYVRHNGKIYKLSEAYSQTAYYGSLNNWGYKTITGMNATAQNAVKDGNTFHLYYDRIRHDLRFHNVSAVTKTVTNIMYEQPLANYKDSDNNLLSAYEPTYPFESYEANPMVFKGWYTTPECFDGTEVDFDTLTMPNSDLTLYAKWVPIGHTVSFYLDKEAYEAGKAGEEDAKLSTHPDVTVPHGEKVTPTPATPVNGDYDFVAWFYMDGNVEKAFDFANMRVTKDMQVYGKWSSNVLKQYFVYFKIQGTDTEVADSITGSSKAGETKTFDAKGDADLYVDYQAGYFPLVKSHSMTLDIENDANNIFTFWYVQKDAVPYTVYYVAETLKDGENAANYKTITRDGKTYYIIAETVINSDNRKAVVTEKFKQVSGYVPDAYQKRLVVDGSEGAVNEIIFYYSVDSAHAYYKITHYTQNVDGNAWTEYASSEALGDIGTTYPADPMIIPGFTHDPKVEGTVVSGELTANGLELKLYYVRNPYPYKVRYLELGTDNELADPKTGTGNYGQVIVKNAIDINGYTAVAPISQTLTIKIEEGENAKNNVITFYYVEKDATINYVVVGPDGCGELNVARETVKVVTGTANGSTATAASQNYKFVGWYSDEACTKQVSTEFEYKPTRPQKGWPDETTYYAKFEPTVGGLTISKTVTGEDAPANAEFKFKVEFSDGGTYNYKKNGTIVAWNADEMLTLQANESVTFEGIPSGITYIVTEQALPTGFYVTAPTNGVATGTIAANVTSTAAFTNEYKPATLTVTKTVTGNAPANEVFNFKVTFGNDTTETFTLSDGGRKTFTNIPLGSFTVEELSVPKEYETTSTNNSGTVAAGGAYTAAFTNTYKPAKLTITKTVTSAGSYNAPDRDFTFKVEFSDKGTYKYTKNNGSPVSLKSGETLTLEAGEAAIFADLPFGITYAVSEQNLPEYFRQTVASGTNGTTERDGKYTAAFTNTYELITVGYTVQYLEQGTNKELAAPKTGHGLVTQAVTENAIPIANYTVVGEASKSINLSKDGNVVIFYYTRDTGTLKITKDLNIDDGVVGTVDNFVFYITGPLDSSKDYTYTVDGNKKNATWTNGKLTIQLPKDEIAFKTAVIAGLPTGEYTVVEHDYKAKGYYAMYTVNGVNNTEEAAVNITKDSTVEVICTNAFPVGTLTITKKVVKECTTDPLTANIFSFNVEGDGLPAGTYSVRIGTAEPQTVVVNTDGKMLLSNISVSVTDEDLENSIIIAGLPSGTYTVTEVMTEEISKDYTPSTPTVTDSISVSDFEATATFINTLKCHTGNLEITKDVVVTLENVDSPRDEFVFYISGPVVDNTSYYYDVKDADGNIKANRKADIIDGKLSVTIDIGSQEKTAVLKNLPIGSYTVSEHNYMPEGYSAEYTGAIVNGVVNVTKGATTAVTCTNTFPVGSLTISKTVTKAYENDAWNGATFTFIVNGNNLTPGTYPVKIGDAAPQNITVSDDGRLSVEANITVSELNTATNIVITGLPSGNYTVIEEPNSDYAPTPGDRRVDTAITATNYAGLASFTNKYNKHLADLTITKDGWNAIDENQSFIFTVTGPNDFVMNVAVQGVAGKNSVTIKDLPIGTYTVTEKTDWSWRYGVNNWKFETTGVDPVNGTTNGATIALGEFGNEIIFTNERPNVFWLDGGTWCDNLFDGTNTTDTPSNSTKNRSIAFADIVLREETTDDEEQMVPLA